MKMFLLTTILLLAGAAAFPAAARDNERDGRRGHESHELVADFRDHRDDRHDDRHDRRDERWDDRHDRRDDRHDRRYDRGHDAYRHAYREKHHGGRYWEGQRHRASYRYVRPRGYQDYTWRVGYRLPAPYYARSYYVDYRYYGLPAPRHGHHWVRIGADVVLVAIATGLVHDAMYDLFY